jgi:hypothetical protein
MDCVSADFLPNEFVKDEMERRLLNLPSQSATLAEIGPALDRICNDIPQASFNTLVGLISGRCQACINANGGHTEHLVSCNLIPINVL